jgi:FkbM family methyltransferase
MRINEFLAKGFRKVAYVANRLAARVSEEDLPENTIQFQRCIPWFRDQGDKTLRLKYDLTEQSIVFDLGGYEGQWTADIFSKYACTIFVFEPHLVYAQNIRNRFSPNPKIKVFDFGLSDVDKKLSLNLSSDSSSLFKRGDQEVEVELRKASDFMTAHAMHTIDLMKINIEGGEYDLIDHLIASGFVQHIKNIQIQFHDFVPDAEVRMKKIQSTLSKTHVPTYQYEFVWENWRRTK